MLVSNEGVFTHAIGGERLNFFFDRGKSIQVKVNCSGEWKPIKPYDLPYNVREVTSEVALDELLKISFITLGEYSNGDRNLKLHVRGLGGVFGETADVLKEMESLNVVIAARQLREVHASSPNVRELTTAECERLLNAVDAIAARQFREVHASSPNVRELTTAECERLLNKNTVKGALLGGAAGFAVGAGSVVAAKASASDVVAAEVAGAGAGWEVFFSAMLMGGILVAIPVAYIFYKAAEKKIDQNRTEAEEASRTKTIHEELLTSANQTSLSYNKLGNIRGQVPLDNDAIELARVEAHEDIRSLIDRLREKGVIKYEERARENERVFEFLDSNFFSKLSKYFQNSDILILTLKVHVLSGLLSLQYLNTAEGTPEEIKDIEDSNLEKMSGFLIDEWESVRRELDSKTQVTGSGKAQESLETLRNVALMKFAQCCSTLGEVQRAIRLYKSVRKVGDDDTQMMYSLVWANKLQREMGV